MEERLKNKILDYCKKNNNFSTYDLHQEFQNEFWNLCASIYGSWLKKNSTLKTKELSTEEWK
tara:strand:- start:7918 stop:8103 length:186 start_codon:yes stop_codon:yes gene_type:complete